jgi:hypothetical protein
MYSEESSYLGGADIAHWVSKGNTQDVEHQNFPICPSGAKLKPRVLDGKITGRELSSTRRGIKSRCTNGQTKLPFIITLLSIDILPLSCTNLYDCTGFIEIIYTSIIYLYENAIMKLIIFYN